MKAHELLKCKRFGLNMTQAEFGAMIGVSTATISKFELGENVSDSMFRKIMEGSKILYSCLSKKEVWEAELRAKVYSLQFETEEEKLVTLQHITMCIAKLNLELLKEDKEF